MPVRSYWSIHYVRCTLIVTALWCAFNATTAIAQTPAGPAYPPVGSLAPLPISPISTAAPIPVVTPLPSVDGQPSPVFTPLAAQQPFDAPVQSSIPMVPTITSPPIESPFGFGLFTPDTAATPSIYPGSAVPIPGPPRAGPYVIGTERVFTGSWTNDGPVWRTQNGDFTFHPRFVNQLDFIAMHAPPPGVTAPGGTGAADGLSFRRLRVGCDGTMWESIDYVFEVDMAFALQNLDPASGSTPIAGLRSGGTVGGVAQNQAGNTATFVQPTTIFLLFKDIPVLGNIRAGNQADWLSLEHIESARFLDFMERAPIMDAFNGPNNNGYTPGVSTYRTYFEQNLGVQLGVYKNNAYDSGFSYDTGENNYSYG
ncbi:MAG TPA: hypothetical protein VHV77_09505, partial [Pirellulales bacterium]|nr:hypothetical protein [Pirellulales bacterium]